MMRLVDYVEKHHSKLSESSLPKDEAELAAKINRFFVEHKPLYRKDVLDYFGISKYTFYRLKHANALNIPEDITNRRNSNKYKEFAYDAKT